MFFAFVIEHCRLWLTTAGRLFVFGGLGVGTGGGKPGPASDTLANNPKPAKTGSQQALIDLFITTTFVREADKLTQCH